MQVFEGRVCPPPDGYIVVAVARFNKTITQRLLDGALAKLRQHRVHDSDIRIVWVPGAYELPFAAAHFAKDEDCLAVICLGAVIKGDTSHDEHINRSISMSFGEIAARYNTPVIFGVLTCNTLEQADARSGMIESVKDKALNPAPGNKGAEAAEAALEMIDLMTELPTPKNEIPEMISRIIQLSKDLSSNDDDYGDEDDSASDTDVVEKFFLPKQKQQRKTAKKAKKK